MMLSVCVIARDEELRIGKCLESLIKYGFEINVVDTGSSDATKEIAAKFTTRIYDFPWVDDFSAAKNYALEQASGDYVMFIDCDESLAPLDPEKLYDDILENPEKAGRVLIRSISCRNGERSESGEWVTRIFPRRLFCYEGRVHEQVVRRDGSKYRTYKTKLELIHTGYDLTEQEWKKKSGRNMALLLMELRQETDSGRVPYLLYQLGKSSYTSGDYESACIYFYQGLGYDLDPSLEYVADMVETYGYALLKSGNASEALNLEGVLPEFGNSPDFCFLMGLVYMNNEMFQKAVEFFLKAAKFRQAKVAGVNSYLAYYNAGVIYECLGMREQACKCYDECGEYAPALERKRAFIQNINK